jgi:AAA15 family ATPase/GTPase
MLLQFAVENYLSFRDRAVLSMVADPRVKHEAGQVLPAPGGREVLRAAAVYGANGSGKSNLVKALGVVREMVLKGTRGEEALPVVPFKLDAAKRDEPAHFEVELVSGEKHYSYGFEATAKQVEAEWLYEVEPGGEERMLFEREAGDEKPVITLGEALGVDADGREFIRFVARGTRQNQLFMAEAGERNVLELDPVRKAIGRWEIVSPNAVYRPLTDMLENSDGFRTVVASVLKEAGTGIHDLRVRTDRGESPHANHDDQGPHVFGVHGLPSGEQVELSMDEESDGTRRLLNLAPILHLMDEHGPDALFAIDELEHSLHPNLSRMLLQVFFARAASGAAAQIIFTTHDTNLLNRSILPRDSIWFVEKDVRGGSVLYPLSDMNQEQLDEVEKQGKGLEKGYLQGRFGAIPFFGSLESLGFRKDLLK